jgi:hypothetical protein
MFTWKIVALFAVLTAALIAAVIHQGSEGPARGGVVADRIPNSHQQIQRSSRVANPAAPAENLDSDRRIDFEPWGPFRTTDW